MEAGGTAAWLGICSLHSAAEHDVPEVPLPQPDMNQSSNVI